MQWLLYPRLWLKKSAPQSAPEHPSCRESERQTEREGDTRSDTETQQGMHSGWKWGGKSGISFLSFLSPSLLLEYKHRLWLYHEHSTGELRFWTLWSHSARRRLVRVLNFHSTRVVFKLAAAQVVGFFLLIFFFFCVQWQVIYIVCPSVSTWRYPGCLVEKTTKTTTTEGEKEERSPVDAHVTCWVWIL